MTTVDTPEAPAVATVGWAEFVDAGLTYRQYDSWCRSGHIRTIGEAQPGSGIGRRHELGEVDVARIMRRLLDLGFLLTFAARLARDPAERERVAHHLLDVADLGAGECSLCRSEPPAPGCGEYCAGCKESVDYDRSVLKHRASRRWQR